MSQVDAVYRVSANLLSKNDRVSLHESLSVEGESIKDTPIGASHLLHPLASRAIQVIESEPIRAAIWIADMLDSGMRERDITEVIEFLNRLGGLCIRRSLPDRLDMLLRQATLIRFGAQASRLAARTPADIHGIFVAVGRAARPLFLLAPAVCLLACVAGIIAPLTALTLLVSLPLLYFSLIIHELSHVFFIRKAGRMPVVLQKGLRLGILHARLPARLEIQAAFAGPLSGAASSCFGFFLLARASDMPGLVFAGYAIGLLHVLSLVPLYGDGRAILRHVIKTFR